MKTTTLTLTSALMLASSLMQAGRLASGLEFRIPAGWTMKSNDTAAMLLPPDMVMEPGGKEPSELYLVALYEGVKNLQDPQLADVLQGKYFPAGARVSAAGAAQPFQAASGAGYLYRYDASSQGVTVRMHIYVVELPGGGVAGLVATARPGLLARREASISAVAASLTRQPGEARQAGEARVIHAAPTGPAAAQWDQRLRGKKLYQFSGYSGSYGSGGMNSQKTLLLATNGVYQFHRSSSVSVYVDGASGGSASQNSAQGRWRIYENGGKVLLELVSSAGVTETIVLRADGSKTLLNGQRWLVGD